MPLFLVLFFFISSLAFSSLLLATSDCNKPTTVSSLTPLIDISIAECEERKKSKKCESLYKQIREAGFEVSERILNCELENQASVKEKISVSYISCLKGGLVDGLAASIKDLGTLLGESTAELVLSMKKNEERLKYCEEHPEFKKRIYEFHNSTIPELLHIEIPGNLAQKSCAQIDRDLMSAINLKEKAISQKTDFKFFQSGKFKQAQTPQEEEYLNWKFKRPEFAKAKDSALIQAADKALEAYNIRVDCYNLQTRVALRCEILFNIVSLVTMTESTLLKALSGKKLSKAEALLKESGTNIKILKPEMNKVPFQNDEFVDLGLAPTGNVVRKTTAINNHWYVNAKGDRMDGSSGFFVRNKVDVAAKTDRDVSIRFSGINGLADAVSESIKAHKGRLTLSCAHSACSVLREAGFEIPGFYKNSLKMDVNKIIEAFSKGTVRYEGKLLPPGTVSFVANSEADLKRFLTSITKDQKNFKKAFLIYSVALPISPGGVAYLIVTKKDP